MDPLHFLTGLIRAKMEASYKPFTEAEWIDMKITTVGLDIAKSVFHLFAINQTGRMLKKKALKRKQLLAYMATLEPCLLVMEACGGAHNWARAFQALGHEVKLIAPQYVKPFVKGNKNDYNDAEAIAEAAQRSTMRFVPIKTMEQQDIQNFHRQRERIKKERTAVVNQVRGLLGEYGVIIKKGVAAVRRDLPLIIEDAENGLTSLSRVLFADLLDELRVIEDRFEQCERRIRALNKERGLLPIGGSAWYRACDCKCDVCGGRGWERVCQRSSLCSLAWSGAWPAFNGRQDDFNRHQQAR